MDTPVPFDHSPLGGTFWASVDGRTEIVRHTDGVFELRHDGAPIMPVLSGRGAFERACWYVWMEFPPPGFAEAEFRDPTRWED